jgi:hypothetical protein
MREASLKIKKYAANVNIINNNSESFVLRAILFAFGALALWYVLILGNIVFNIIERKTAEAAVRVLVSDVSDLELDYLALSNNVDLEMSHSLGFKEVKPKFAVRKSLGSLGSLSMARNEI